jgi:hypothetical protein
MQTNIAYSLMGQNARLLTELWKRRRSKAANELMFVLRYELLRIVCGMIWDINLLKTSIFVTKTPWTTLKCLSRNYVGRKRASHASASKVKERMLGAAKDIKENSLRALKQFVDHR